MKRGPKPGPRPATILRVKAMRSLFDAGWLREDISKVFDCQYQLVCRHLRSVGVCDKGNAPVDPSRHQQMVDLYKSGRSLADIGVAYNLTRERVRQIMAKNGVTRIDGGAHVASIAKAPQRAADARDALARRMGRANARAHDVYGCSYEEAVVLNGGLGVSIDRSRARQYIEQSKSANYRGIEWKLTFPEWCEIWEKSGKEALRGRGKGKFCMSRLGDTGPYAKDNVRVCECVVNSKEGSELIGAYSGRKRAQVDARGLTTPQAKLYDLWLGGLRPMDIARQLGLRAKTVHGQLSIARRKVKELSA